MSLSLKQRLDAFVQLGDYIKSRAEHLDAYVQRSSHHNAWFTPDNQWRMLNVIAEDYLDRDKLDAWIAAYPGFSVEPFGKTIGIVMAGNIPLVGFHDFLAVLLSGNHAMVKLSEKDPYVLPHLVKKLEEIEPGLIGKTSFVERLKDFDAVIATGSNNTSRYFKEYFGKYPHIIRGNRTSVAILHGSETELELAALADDVFAYFGQGCRSIGKIYVPRNFVFEPLLDALHEHKLLANHSKWKNNFDYNFALYSINREPFLMTGAIMLREASEIHSRLATLHYEYYDDLANLILDLHALRDSLQQVLSTRPMPGLQTVGVGQGQRPGLCDYADDVDVMQWLLQLIEN